MELKKSKLDGAIMHSNGFTRKTIPDNNETVITEFPYTFDEDFCDNLTQLFIFHQKIGNQSDWVFLMYFGEEHFYLALPGEMSQEKVYKYFQPIIDIMLLKQAQENKHVH